MEENRVITKDYLIPDVENKDDYREYKVQLFRTVPVKTALVCKNIITGVITARPKGLTFVLPWVSTKLVSLASKTIDYPKEIYKTSDGIEVGVDFALTVRVMDPVAFEVNSQNPLQEVGILAMDLMRAYVAGVEAEILYKQTVTLRDIDPTDQLANITNLTGIKVSNIYVKNIELPKTIKDDFEKRVAATKERDIAQIKADTLRTQSQGEADAASIKATATIKVELAKMRDIILTLQQNGYSNEQILDFLRTSQFANGTAQVIANLDGKTDSSVLSATQAVANSILSNSGNVNHQNSVNPVRVRRGN